MSRVLHGPALAGTARVVADVEPIVDSVIRALLEQAEQEAYRRGHADGRKLGREEGRRDVGELSGAVSRATGELVDAVRSMRAEQAVGTVELATAIAAHVLDREPGDGGQALLRRVRQWLSEVDDRPVRLAVSSIDQAVMTAALGGDDDITVVVDPSLGAGEARFVGAWVSAELSRARQWDEVQAVLDGS